MRRVAVTAAVLLACSAVGAQPTPLPAEVPRALTAEEQRAAVDLVHQHPGRRLVLPEDHAGPSLERYRQLAPGYEPYVARGDFDRDGRSDVVVALEGEGEYDVYLLHPGTERAPEWVAGLQWLDEAGFFVRTQGGGDQLGIGSLFSDDAVWFGWNADTAQMEALPSEMIGG